MKTINITNYEHMLAMGIELASGRWETNFMQDTSDKYDKYGKDMFVSDKQVAMLAKISGIDPIIDMEAKPPAKPGPVPLDDDEIPF